MPPSSACAAHWVIPPKILPSSKLSRVAATAFSYPSTEWRRNAFRIPVVAPGETHPVPMPGQVRTYRAEKDAARFAVSWFPDGSHVLATRVASLGEKPSLWSVSVFGGSPRKLMDAAALGAVSPEG